MLFFDHAKKWKGTRYAPKRFQGVSRKIKQRSCALFISVLYRVLCQQLGVRKNCMNNYSKMDVIYYH